MLLLDAATCADGLAGDVNHFLLCLGSPQLFTSTLQPAFKNAYNRKVVDVMMALARHKTAHS
jgi:hypothetical protein